MEGKVALIICTYCKREISNKAEVCPSCRHPIKSQKMTKLGIIIAIIGLVVYAIIITALSLITGVVL